MAPPGPQASPGGFPVPLRPGSAKQSRSVGRGAGRLLRLLRQYLQSRDHAARRVAGGRARVGMYHRACARRHQVGSEREAAEMAHCESRWVCGASAPGCRMAMSIAVSNTPLKELPRGYISYPIAARSRIRRSISTRSGRSALDGCIVDLELKVGPGELTKTKSVGRSGTGNPPGLAPVGFAVDYSG